MSKRRVAFPLFSVSCVSERDHSSILSGVFFDAWSVYKLNVIDGSQGGLVVDDLIDTADDKMIGFISAHKFRLCFLFVQFFAVCSLSLADAMDPQLADCLEKFGVKHGWETPKEFTELTCHNKEIRSLAGLERYSNLEKLSLHKNLIQQIDLSVFPNLHTLNLARNKLKNLDVVGLQHLEKLYVFNNKLQSLTLRDLPKLKHFKANSNGMVEFEYRGVPNLKKIYLFDNEIEHIDIDAAPVMTYMDVRQNPMPDELYEEMDKRTSVTILHDGNADDWD